MDQEVQPADRPVDEISSLCMRCHEQGTTRLLLTRIPFFREIVIMSFSCPSCHFQNSEIQSAGEIQQRGVRYNFKPDCVQDLQRQIVKGDSCVIKVEDVDLEMPAGRGQLTNLEGLFRMVIADLQGGQEARKELQPEVAEQIDVVIERLIRIVTGESLPCTIKFDDPAGNSSLEPNPSDGSGKYIRAEYPRTTAQNEVLGLSSGPDEAKDTPANSAPPPSLHPEYSAAAQLYPAPPPPPQQNGHTSDLNGTHEDEDIIENQVYSFPTACPGCTHPVTVNMKMVRIPHFAEVVIMSTSCPHCGYRSNEVKSGGSVSDKGRRLTLQVRDRKDLSRDILKAESCRLECPELQLNVEPGTLGGRFTTVEGLLVQVGDDLRSSVFDVVGNGRGADASVLAGSSVLPIRGGDSMEHSERVKWEGFFRRLDEAVEGRCEFTMILTDPLASSYVQSFEAPKADARLHVEDYERTKEEEEDLGLRDMKTEGYEGDPNSLKDGNKSNGASNGETGDENNPVDVEAVQAAVHERMRQLEDQ